MSIRNLFTGMTLLAGGWLAGQATFSLSAGGGTPQELPPTVAQPEAKRVIAYIHGNVPITREEFGDYLISVYGSQQRIETFVNRRLIEIEAAKKGIDIPDTVIDATIEDDCKRLNISKDDFVRTVLRQRYGKSLEEWRLDVLRPRLMLAEMSRTLVTVEPADLQQVYENRFGKKVRCKIIIWPKDQKNVAFQQYGQLRSGDAQFDAIATKQADATIAARAGEIEPIGRFSGKHSEKVEETAFKLNVGDVSEIIEVPFGFLVIKCIGHIEPTTGLDMAKIRPELEREVRERKLEVEIPKLFAKMKENANVTMLLTPVRMPAARSEAPIQQTSGTQPGGK